VYIKNLESTEYKMVTSILTVKLNSPSVNQLNNTHHQIDE